MKTNSKVGITVPGTGTPPQPLKDLPIKTREEMAAFLDADVSVLQTLLKWIVTNSQIRNAVLDTMLDVQEKYKAAKAEQDLANEL